VPLLETGTSSSAQTWVTIPAGTATGTYYLIAKADAANDVPEATETNNTRLVSVRVGPDLQVSLLTVPTRGASGGPITLTDTTKNAGAATAGASTTAFYLSSDFRLDAGDVRLTPARAVGTLTAGAAVSGTTNVVLPDVAPGTWYLVAQADDQGAVVETMETNNTRFATIAIGPDLDVTALSAPLSATAGASIVVTDTVKNLGRNTAGASATRFYLSVDFLFDGSDVLLGDRPVPELADSATNLGSVTLVLPGTASGSYYLIAVADGAGTVAESSEANNTMFRSITINPQ
jgi:hypothetical protein